MIEGLQMSLSPSTLTVVLIGVFLGIIVGALPGFTATMGTALLLPFTFDLEPLQGLAMLGALYVSSQFADAVPACLVNTPGTPSAVATAFDGYAMTLKGFGQKALIAAGFSALAGSVIGGFTFLFLAEPLASVALKFGPAEFFWVGVFAVTIIGSIAGDSLLRGLCGGFLGMLIGTVGISATGSVPRYTFGQPDLLGGVNIVAALVGVFALPQVLEMIGGRKTHATIAKYTRSAGVALATVLEILRKPVNLIRSSVIGTVVGIMPGAGGPVASLVAYNEAQRWSKNRKNFGHGEMDGVVASESAGNGAAAGSLVPLVSLGIPGSAPAAVILGALMLQGIQPGPQLFGSQPELVLGFAWTTIFAGIITFVAAVVLAGSLARMVMIPVIYLGPIVLFLSVVGSYAIRSNMTDVYLMVGIGIVTYLLGHIGIHAGPIGLGIILGPIIEPALVQAMSLTHSTSIAHVFFGSSVSWILITLTVASSAWVVWSSYKERRDVALDS